MKEEPTPETVFAIVNRHIPNEQNKIVTVEETEAAIKKIYDLGVSCFELVAQCLNLQPNGRVRAMLEYGEQSAVPFIQYALDSSYSITRSQALQIARKREDIKLLQDVFYTHSEDNMRDSAAEFLVRFGDEGTQIVEQGLESRDEKTRSAAAQAMTKFLRENQDVSIQFRERNITRFTELLNDNSAQVRRSAFSTLRTFNRLTNPIITRCTKDDNAGLRFDAYYTLLTRHVDEFSTQLFALAIEDPDGGISSYLINEINPEDRPNRFVKDPRALANAIIETLIVRHNELPNAQFNPDRT